MLGLFSHCLIACDNDITKFMIMLVVALRTTMHRDFVARTQGELLSGEVPVFPSLPISVRSVGETLGLPKETIRRKVTELANDGWLVREHGRLYFTAAAYQQLSPVREQIEELAARYYEVVAALKAETEAARPSR
ncbi:MAG: DeoR family transcriptional regulator [Phenylobacterium sp.]|nr:DeoR family transcriptional regulator [Phenylobacterium sp.]